MLGLDAGDAREEPAQVRGADQADVRDVGLGSDVLEGDGECDDLVRALDRRDGLRDDGGVLRVRLVLGLAAELRDRSVERPSSGRRAAAMVFCAKALTTPRALLPPMNGRVSAVL